jgi:hypothetical protein
VGGHVLPQLVNLLQVDRPGNDLVEVAVPEVAFVEHGVLSEAAGQPAFVQHTPGDDRHAVLPADRDEVVQGERVEDVDDRLHRVDQAALDERQGHVRAVVGDRDADVADQPVLLELLQLVHPVAGHAPRRPPDVQLDQIDAIQP